MSGEDRRGFFKTAGRAMLRLGVAGGLLYAVQAAFRGPAASRPREERSTGILRPPGALDEAAFLAACVRCDLCSEVCDTSCIKIFGPGEGRHAGTPYVIAEERGCNLCLECTGVCPSGALQPMTAKSAVRMGLAVVDERLCVSHNGTGACGACHTVCPFRSQAITQGIRNAPEVHESHCTGCGLCEEACIVHDRRAIRVVTKRSWS